jgi:hypothetical protein
VPRFWICTDFARGRLQRVEGGRQIGVDDIGPGCRGADSDAVAADADPVKRSHVREIDIVARQRALARGRKYVRGAGDDAGAAG